MFQERQRKMGAYKGKQYKEKVLCRTLLLKLKKNRCRMTGAL
jgi:hypothetical protein